MHYPIARLLSDSSLINETVEIRGWVRTRRDSKAGFSFLQVNDGSCFDSLQAVIQKSLPNYDSEVLRLTASCAVVVRGILVESQGKNQTVELQAESVEVVGWVDDPDTYPIQPKRHTMEFLREVAHLRPRTNTFGALARLRHRVAFEVHRFFTDRGFYWVSTPIITANDCEGAGELFRVSTLDLLHVKKDDAGRVDFKDDFFGRETFLTVSGQLNVESYCAALSKVYTFGPTFRAENSNTSRHLAEFWMIEPEIAFADLKDNAALAQGLLQHLARALLDHCDSDLNFFVERIDAECRKRLEMLAETDFDWMEYSEAIEILKNAKRDFEYPIEWGVDLQSEHERYISEEHVGRPVIMVNYPKDIKGFYMRLNEDERTVAAMDVLVPGVGEIIGGSQREERLEVLDRRMDEMKLDKDDYGWYRDLRRYGSVPHAGFGLGFERFLSYVTGLKNVRDVIPFPRTPGSIVF